MISVTRLNHEPIVLNCHLIECIEATPDTVISLTNGQKLMVLESAEEIVARVVEYERRIHEVYHGSLAQRLSDHSRTGEQHHGGR